MRNNHTNSCFLSKGIVLFLFSLTLSAMDSPPEQSKSDDLEEIRWSENDLIELESLRAALAKAPLEVMFFDIVPDTLYQKLLFIADESSVVAQQIKHALGIFEFGFYLDDLPNNQDLLKLLKLADKVAMSEVVEKAIGEKSLENYNTIDPFTFSSEVLARAITTVQLIWFKQIPHALFLRKPENCLVDNLIAKDASIGALLTLKILLEPNAKIRARNFDKLYKTAVKLEEMGNLAGTILIFTALDKLSRLIEDAEQIYPKLVRYAKYPSKQFEFEAEVKEKNPIYLLPLSLVKRNFVMNEGNGKENQKEMMRKFALQHHENMSRAKYIFETADLDQNLISLLLNIPHNVDTKEMFYELSGLAKAYKRSKEEQDIVSEKYEGWSSLQLANFFLDRNLPEQLEKFIRHGIFNGETLKDIFMGCSCDEEKVRIISARFMLPREVSWDLVKSVKFVKDDFPKLRRSNSSKTPRTLKRLSGKKNDRITETVNDVSPSRRKEPELEIFVKNSDNEKVASPASPRFKRRNLQPGDNFKKSNHPNEIPATSPRLGRARNSQPGDNFKRVNSYTSNNIEHKKFKKFTASDVDNLIWSVKNLNDSITASSILGVKSGKEIFMAAFEEMNKEISNLELAKFPSEVLLNEKSNNDEINKKIRKLKPAYGVNQTNMYCLYFEKNGINKNDAWALADEISRSYPCPTGDFQKLLNKTKYVLEK